MPEPMIPAKWIDEKSRPSIEKDKCSPLSSKGIEIWILRAHSFDPHD
jgi:hypothetical protein